MFALHMKIVRAKISDKEDELNYVNIPTQTKLLELVEQFINDDAIQSILIKKGQGPLTR